MQRLPQIVLILATGLGSWLGMQAVHEAGHAIGASATGGRVTRVVLHPLTISRTDLAQNPHPLIVVWAGPVFGACAPLLAWALAAALRLPGAFVLRFFAGFCLIANGLYIGVGSIQGIGDCGEMLRHGSAAWQLWLFGFATSPAGLALWHGQSAHFGFGPAQGRVSRGVAGVVLLVCGALVILGFFLGNQSP